MSKVIRVLLIFAGLSAAQAAHAQGSSTAAPAGAQSGDRNAEQVAACHLKVNQLAEQLRPLQAKRTSLWAERKTIGHSGGETAKFKLANLDKELVQVTKQIDGVNGQINSEKKRCDDLAAKPASGARGEAPAKPRGRP